MAIDLDMARRGKLTAAEQSELADYAEALEKQREGLACANAELGSLVIDLRRSALKAAEKPTRILHFKDHAMSVIIDCNHGHQRCHSCPLLACSDNTSPAMEALRAMASIDDDCLGRGLVGEVDQARAAIAQAKRALASLRAPQEYAADDDHEQPPLTRSLLQLADEATSALGIPDSAEERAASDARVMERFKSEVDRALHPTGRCSCGGEGTCVWCQTHCVHCGTEPAQHGPGSDHYFVPHGPDRSFDLRIKLGMRTWVYVLDLGRIVPGGGPVVIDLDEDSKGAWYPGVSPSDEEDSEEKP